MNFSSPTNHGGGGQQRQQCPPPPPSSPIGSRRQSGYDAHSQSSSQHHQHQSQHHQQQQQPQQQPLPQQQIANLLQFAQSSYTTNPTDALSALMDALTLSTGNNAAAHHAMDRIRTELGDVVADCVAGNVSNAGQQQQQMQHDQNNQLSEREMTLRAMEVVQQMLNDTSTFLYAQGRQHILQQAMEDGSSVVCSKCGDMISRDRWMQHAEYWCSALEEKAGCEDDESMDG